LTPPAPLPDAPLVIEIHAALSVAVQVHPVVVETLTLSVPPLDGTLSVVGDTVKAHAPLWLTVMVWPATVSAPLRDDVEVLAATV
jgi:hypothetical protein